MKKIVRQADQASEQGFSLVELLIAMVVTLIVCGAVMSLLTQANRVFQMQPDMTERQQNIRAAMDLIMRDIANAGSGLPWSAQVFVSGLQGAGHAAPAGGNSDDLEMLTNDLGLDPVPPLAGTTLATAPLQFVVHTTTFKALAGGPAIPVALLLSYESGQTEPRFAMRLMAYTDGNTGTAASATFTPGMCGDPNTTGNSSNLPGSQVGTVQYQDVVHYRVWDVPDETDTRVPPQPVPVLQRQSAAGGCAWQTVARGIEDMRVRYRRAQDILTNPTASAATEALALVPLPAVMNSTTPADSDNITVEVEVTLRARGNQLATTAAARRAMMTQAADGTSAYRGTLVSRGTPRAALLAMSYASSDPRKWK